MEGCPTTGKILFTTNLVRRRPKEEKNVLWLVLMNRP